MIDPRIFWSSLLGAGLGAACTVVLAGAVLWSLLAT
jgi:hypothetical protein